LCFHGLGTYKRSSFPRERRLDVTRSWIRRAMIAGAMATVGAAALVGMAALAYDETTVLVGASEARQHNRRGVNMVAKVVNSPYVPSPGPEPPDLPPRKQMPSATTTSPGLEGPEAGGEGGLAIGGVNLTATVSPEARLEMSLKDLARELR
jgi:hypothetical protein